MKDITYSESVAIENMKMESRVSELKEVKRWHVAKPGDPFDAVIVVEASAYDAIKQERDDYRAAISKMRERSKSVLAMISADKVDEAYAETEWVLEIAIEAIAKWEAEGP